MINGLVLECLWQQYPHYTKYFVHESVPKVCKCFQMTFFLLIILIKSLHFNYEKSLSFTALLQTEEEQFFSPAVPLLI